MSNIDKAMGMKFLTRCLAIAVCTKNNNWNDDEYQQGVIEPYRKIHKMVEQLENEDQAPTIGQLHEAFDMLKSVFVTKGTSLEEQNDRFNQIFAETKMIEYFPEHKKF